MTSAERVSGIVFRGIDGNECEEFIAAIEELAFTEEWSRDRERMLLFARSRLRHKALRWFARLDPSKQNDWYLFIEALFDHYPLVEAPPGVEPIWSETTFSPGDSTPNFPSDQVLGLQTNAQDGRQTTEIRTRQVVPPNGRAYDPSILGRQLGILRVVVEDGTTCPQYVSRGRPPTYQISAGSSSIQYCNQLDTTVDLQEALVVCFIPSTEPHQIGCLNTTNNARQLHLSYHPTYAYRGYGLHALNGPRSIDGHCKKDSFVSNIWNVLSDGSLEASLIEFDANSYNYSNRIGYERRENFKTTQVHLETSGTDVRFVKPDSKLGQDEIRARLVFAPL